VAGANFGCGSSREHAAWALRDFGFAAIVARSFSDIFRANALENGLLPAAIEDAAWSQLVASVEAGATVTIEVSEQRVEWETHRTRFPLDPFARTCLLEGIDQLGYLLSQASAIAEFERAGSHSPSHAH
jgi:3-isopropylmalate/(R)-2-methylmalate dehydratase small subunit